MGFYSICTFISVHCSGCGDRIRIDPLHPGIVVVFVEPFFQCIFCRHAFSPCVVPDQCHAGHHNVAAHKDDQCPGDDFSRFHRNLFDPVGQTRIQKFEPDHRSDAPEKAIQQEQDQQYWKFAKQFRYKGKILLVGINYNSKTKKHTCKIKEIESLEKN